MPRPTAAWRLPMHGGFATVRTVLDFPWIARRSRRDPRRRAAPDRRRRRPATGAGVVRGLWRSRHDGWRITPARRTVWHGPAGRSAEPTDAPPDALSLDRDHLATLGLRYEDLVAACDVVASKPGYGIVSECVANGAALLYTDRGRFREYPVMVEQMPEVMRCRFIASEAMAGGRWDGDVEALLAQPRPDGASARERRRRRRRHAQRDAVSPSP